LTLNCDASYPLTGFATRIITAPSARGLHLSKRLNRLHATLYKFPIKATMNRKGRCDDEQKSRFEEFTQP
jgi:hypothetical protein